MNDPYAPRTSPEGHYERICRNCATEFRTDNPRSAYCSESCKKAAANHRYYNRHRTAVIKRILNNRHSDK